MNFNKHSTVEGQHAFLGASKYHWINYTPEKLIETYKNFIAAQRGTELHEFAAQCIRLKQRLPDIDETLNLYVNDSIDFGMAPEQLLFYSENCFGTADAISFRNNHLQIHDLKTGSILAHVEQLKIYAALFCLEYDYHPNDITIELRIYQNCERFIFCPDPTEIINIMDKIVNSDKIISELKREEFK